jgi:L-fuculose-phosphate aldolase
VGGAQTERSATGQAAASIITSAERLLEAGVLSFSGHGNASQLAADGELLLTSRGSLRGLGENGLARLMVDGTVVEGTVEPANLEIIDMHTSVYRARPDVRAIIHTHSPNVTAFALAHRPLPSRYESTIRFGIVDDIPVAPWGPRGSRLSVDNILATLEAHPGVRAVLLANHGLLAFGSDAIEVARIVIALEEAALLTLGAELLGGARPLPPGALDEVRERMMAFGTGTQVGSR